MVILPIRDRSRSIANKQQIIDLVNHYSITIKASSDFSETTNLKEQASFSHHMRHVKIIAHGAGEVNNMFQPSDTAIIEVFPYGTKNMIFERHAHHLGK